MESGFGVHMHTVSSIPAIPLVNTLLSDLLISGRRGFVMGSFVDSGIEITTDCFTGAVDHANALSDGFAEFASHGRNLAKYTVCDQESFEMWGLIQVRL